MNRCNICGYVFEDEWLLVAHVEIYHNPTNIGVEVDVEELQEHNMNHCNVCGAEFEDESLLVAHQEINHNSDNIANAAESEEMSRPSVIQYAPAREPSINATLQAHALPGRIVTHFKIDNAKLKLEDFVNNAKPLVLETLQNELRRLNFIKFGLLLDGVFTNIQNETS